MYFLVRHSSSLLDHKMISAIHKHVDARVLKVNRSNTIFTVLWEEGSNRKKWFSVFNKKKRQSYTIIAHSANRSLQREIIFWYFFLSILFKRICHYCQLEYIIKYVFSFSQVECLIQYTISIIHSDLYSVYVNLWKPLIKRKYQ